MSDSTPAPVEAVPAAAKALTLSSEITQLVIVLRERGRGRDDTDLEAVHVCPALMDLLQQAGLGLSVISVKEMAGETAKKIKWSQNGTLSKGEKEAILSGWDLDYAKADGAKTDVLSTVERTAGGFAGLAPPSSKSSNTTNYHGGMVGHSSTPKGKAKIALRE